MLRRFISFNRLPANDLTGIDSFTGKRWNRLERAVIQVTGVDAVKFLNGLCTNNVQRLAQDPECHGLYTAFLSPQQGRVLFDAFLYKVTPDCFLVEVDDKLGFDVQYHLQNYLVRNRVKIEEVTDKKSVIIGWNRLAESFDGAAFFHDPRAINHDLRAINSDGWRITRYILPKGFTPPWPEAEEVNEEEYHRLRYWWGVVEGPQEIPRKQAIPLEFNLDWMNAIDFAKGCYLGQELVARTHAKGVVRKRIMPCAALGTSDRVEGKPLSDNLYAAEPANATQQTELRSVDSAKPLGQLIGRRGNFALGMIRIDDWTQRAKPNLALNVMTALESNAPNWHLFRPYRPRWWPKEQL